MIRLLATVLLALLVPGVAQAQEDVRCDAPQVLIVLDKSSSMNGLVPSGVTKWEAAREAVVQVTASFGGRVDFGIMIFPSPNQCHPGTVEVDCGSDTSGDIEAALGDAPPEFGNYTPMAESIAAAGGHDQLAAPDRRSYVLLITDGWQWCDPYDPDTRFAPVDEVGALLTDRGLVTYVVGFGDAVDVATLNRAAAAGGAPIDGCDPNGEDLASDDHCYYQTDDIDSLAAALDEIAQHITEEECDGFDNDCDFLVDEDFDLDEDGYTTCGGPGGEGVDCDDARDDVNVGATESCDAVDNDCDGAVDLGCDCLPDDARACGVCDLGEQVCGDAGAWLDCEEPADPPTEACNGEDDDCDGVIDEAARCEDPELTCVEGDCVDLSPPDDDEDVEVPPEDEEPQPLDEPDAGAPEPFGGRDTTVEGGCACHTTSSAGETSATWVMLGLLAIAMTLRRRQVGSARGTPR
jgi:MYXO-CTERM domain-containing protein